MISGFPSRAEGHQHLYAKPIQLPSLHIWGLKDDMVVPEESKKLAEKFRAENRHTLEHKRGHMVPSDAVCRKAVCDFVLPFAKRLYLDAAKFPRAAL